MTYSSIILAYFLEKIDKFKNVNRWKGKYEGLELSEADDVEFQRSNLPETEFESRGLILPQTALQMKNEVNEQKKLFIENFWKFFPPFFLFRSINA